jgi:phage baseplate assembly protein W
MAERASVTNLVNINDFKVITTRYPQFDEPLKGNPVIKVSYVTYIQRCLRCRASGIENDIRLATSGEPITIRNENLLNQGVLKMVITRKGSNPFHPEIGSTIIDKIGTKAVGATATSINEDVTRAVNLYQRLQTAQGKVQEITLRERLYSILSVTTNPAVDAAPGAAALVGTNGLSLGLAPLGIPGF